MLSARSAIFRHVGRYRGTCSRPPLARREVGRPDIKDGIVSQAKWANVSRQIRQQSNIGKSARTIFCDNQHALYRSLTKQLL